MTSETPEQKFHLCEQKEVVLLEASQFVALMEHNHFATSPVSLAGRFQIILKNNIKKKSVMG